MNTQFLVACLLLLAMAGAAHAAGTDSTGAVVQGFTIVSNVTGHLIMAKDACDIATIASAPGRTNFTEIASIYRTGRNSIRPDGKTTRALAAWTAGAHATGNPYFANGSSLFNDTNWIGSFMTSALTPGDDSMTNIQKSIAAIHTSSLQVLLSYSMSELYGIAEEIDPMGTNVTSTGAPHALDEAFGVYVGSVSACAPWSYAEEAAHHFGTMLPDCSRSMVNEVVIREYKVAQAATIKGNVTQYKQARDAIIGAYQVSLIQSVLMRAGETQDAWRALAMATVYAQDAADAFLAAPDERHHRAAAATAAALENATMAFEFAKADVYTVWRALGPFVHMCSPYAAHALDTYLHIDAPVSNTLFTAVRYALMQLLPQMGLTADMIGTHQSGSNCAGRR